MLFILKNPFFFNLLFLFIPLKVLTGNRFSVLCSLFYLFFVTLFTTVKISFFFVSKNNLYQYPVLK